VTLFDSNSNIRGFDVASNTLLIWNGYSISVYEINTNSASSMVTEQFSALVPEAKFVGVHMDSVLKIEEYSVYVMNKEGLIKQDLNFPKSEGSICG
jgi:DNA topoisomerase VI subunit A